MRETSYILELSVVSAIKLNCTNISATHCPIPLLYKLRLEEWARGDVLGRRAMHNQRYRSLFYTDSDASMYNLE